MGMTETLRERYPSIYKDAAGKSTLDYGISCGEGWFVLLDTLSALIVERASARNLTVQVLQVKEKFGGLRFYLRGHDRYISGLIGAAESLAYRHCEKCGKLGRLYAGGWRRILCCEHFEAANREALPIEGYDDEDEMGEDGLPDYDKAEAAGEMRFNTYDNEPADEAAERREGFDRMIAALQARTDPGTGALRP